MQKDYHDECLKHLYMYKPLNVGVGKSFSRKGNSGFILKGQR